MWFSMVVIVLAYLGVSVFGCLNTYRYIIKQKRYRNVPLFLFYLFAILACGARLGRYIAMIYDYSEGNAIFTLIAILVDLMVQCCIAIAGFCLVTSMFELYTNVNLILIELESYDTMNNDIQRRREQKSKAMEKQQTARRKFVVFKVLIYLGIAALLGATIFQLTVIYLDHRGEDLKDFA